MHLDGLRYQNLAADLAEMIDARVLAPGERLPSIRRLAQERRLSISTVVLALRQLEDRGLVEAKPQSGYFVRPPRVTGDSIRERQTPEAPSPVDISQRLVRVLHAAARSGVAPLAMARAAPELLPVAPLQRLYSGVARRHGALLAAASHSGMNQPALVRQLVRHSLAWGGPLAADELVITNSCTEALNLCLRAVTQPGDTVAVESPSYYLTLQLLETLGLQALEIPTHPRDGMSVEALELATRNGDVKACLLVANASNPLGSVMPDARKQQFAALTASRGVAVIEDDLFGDLCFGAHRPWPIKAFDRANNVMLCSSFSKTLTPAIRIGFVATGRYHDAVTMQKVIASGSTNPITQQVLAEYLASSAYDRHLRSVRRSYQRQVEAMQDSVARHFPADTRVSQPQGGFVLWVELPEAIDTSLVYERAIAEQIAYVPGELFSASGMYRNCLRLNCGNPHTPVIEDAIRRLGVLFTRAATTIRNTAL